MLRLRGPLLCHLSCAEALPVSCAGCVRASITRTTSTRAVTSSGRRKHLPKPEAVQGEIDALREWVADVKRRQGQVGSLK